MKKMDQSSEIRPSTFDQVIHVDETVTNGVVKFDCGPAVFKLCEKANGKRNMYVVVEGSICVQKSAAAKGSFETMGFRTKVGYFRHKGDRLEHVYGAHYDMDERGVGHPVFHAQLSPMMDLATAIQDQFILNEEVVDVEVVDHVGTMLRNVRTPSAQMDFFSVFTQLCADHLMSANPAGSHPQVTEAFDCVRKACDSLLGAAHRLVYLNDGKAPMCYRSSHWYGPA